LTIPCVAKKQVESQLLEGCDWCPQATRAASAGAEAPQQVVHTGNASGNPAVRKDWAVNRVDRDDLASVGPFSDSSPAWTQVKPATCTRRYTRTHSSMQMRRGSDLLIKLSWVFSPVVVVYNFLPMHRISESPSFISLINELICDVIILGPTYSKFVFPTASPPLFSSLTLHLSLCAFLPLAHR